MSDMFDDIEKLLAEEAAAAEKSSEAVVDSDLVAKVEEAESFNESELEDIMAEIDSLEGDFESSENFVEAIAETDLAVDSSQKNKTDLQMEIEKEIAMLDTGIVAESESDHDEIPEEVQNAFVPAVEEVEAEIEELASSTLLHFEKKTEVVPSVDTHSTKSKSEMSFSASGTMNLNLSFKIGQEEARLYIDEVKGLVVTLSGVELCLNEVSGCSVTMENGVNFNIPLTSKDSSSKKKAA